MKSNKKEKPKCQRFNSNDINKFDNKDNYIAELKQQLSKVTNELKE